ncbi:MAG: RluA family pseudouridine synthase [Acidobacteriota bacterium]|nr:MAG: RluA family pseudouridine synthase [Acidobacteriota bacterium]
MAESGKTEWKVTKEEAGLRLDKWLAMRLGSRSKALTALAKGKVFLDQTELSSSDAARKMSAGETIRLWMDRPGSARRRYTERRSSGLHIIFEDPSLLIVNKPAGLLTVQLASKPDEPSLIDLVKHHLRSQHKKAVFVVHRIDRDTSGLVVIAKSPEAQRRLKEQFERREPQRIYLAVVHGHPSPPSGTWRDKLVWDKDELQQRTIRKSADLGTAREAITHYRVVEKLPDHALIEVRLETGKRNQIRIQAALHGHPLAGEKIYVDREAVKGSTQKIGRQALHAWKLSFKHPVDGRKMEFMVDPPQDFQKLIN